MEYRKNKHYKKLNKLKKHIKSALFNIFYIFDHFNKQYMNFIHRKEVELLKKKFLKVGQLFYLGKDYVVHNPQYMEFGEDFSAKARFRIEAIDKYGSQVFQPKISIGNNVKFLYDIHIGCINKISIGDNCLFASRIYISDHNHGDTTSEMLKIIPVNRPIMSKGEIVIKDNVWVGEGAAILGGVTIGKNSIIATNAVVTKDVPENSVVAGVPAKVIKTIV